MIRMKKTREGNSGKEEEMRREEKKTSGENGGHCRTRRKTIMRKKRW